MAPLLSATIQLSGEVPRERPSVRDVSSIPAPHSMGLAGAAARGERTSDSVVTIWRRRERSRGRSWSERRSPRVSVASGLLESYLWNPP